MMIGQQIDRYTIQEMIGQGGMATVYRAYDSRFERDVAIKFLYQPPDPHDMLTAEKFAQEAKLIAGLEHHAIVPVYDFGEYRDTPYFVMRLMDGGTLKDRLLADDLTLADIASILVRICSALDKAHQQSIVHRDIKPGNILFDDDGMAYLADFGIARLTDRTQTMSLIGSPRYMAPEQARGEKLTHHTDIYQMGVVLFHMLAGRVPFIAESTDAILYQHVYEPVPSITRLAPDLPAACDEVMRQALAKDPTERYQSAGGLARAFQVAIGYSPGPLGQVKSPPPRVDQSPRPQPEADHDAGTYTIPPRPVTPADFAGRPKPTQEPEPEYPEPQLPPAYQQQWEEPVSAAWNEDEGDLLIYEDEELYPEPAPRRRWGWILVLGIVAVVLFGCGAGVLAFNNPEWFLPGLADDPAAELSTRPPTLDPNTGEGFDPEELEEETGEDPELAPTATVETDEAPVVAAIEPAVLADRGGGTGIVAYAANRDPEDPNAFDIYVLEDDGSERKITDHPDADFRPVFSPDGSKIAYHSLRDTWEVFVVNADGSSPTNITNHPADDSFPSWSPDGRQLTFHSNRDSRQFDIFVADSDGTNLRQLTNTLDTNEFGPSWSPDGQLIAFHRQMPDNSRHIFIMNADGTNERQITTGSARNQYPVWSPNGRALVFFSDADGTTQIYTMTASGDNISQITSGSEGSFYPTWSTNGEWIIYHTIEEGTNRELYMVRADGSGRTRLTETETQERMPSWKN